LSANFEFFTGLRARTHKKEITKTFYVRNSLAASAPGFKQKKNRLELAALKLFIIILLNEYFFCDSHTLIIEGEKINL
jgi:hypothetical protein